MIDYITRIRTIDGDKQIDYNTLENLLISYGVFKNTLTVRDIILIKRNDYRSNDPAGGIARQMYFKKVT